MNILSVFYCLTCTIYETLFNHNLLLNFKKFMFLSYYLQSCLFIEDISSQANLLLVNLKEIIDKLQAKNTSYQNKIKMLTIENNQLIVSNKNLTSEVESLKTNVIR